jgi:hypothetical protein
VAGPGSLIAGHAAARQSLHEAYQCIFFGIRQAHLPDLARVHIADRFRRGPAGDPFARIVGLTAHQHVACIVEVHDSFQIPEVSVMAVRLHKSW